MEFEKVKIIMDLKFILNNNTQDNINFNYNEYLIMKL